MAKVTQQVIVTVEMSEQEFETTLNSLHKASGKPVNQFVRENLKKRATDLEADIVDGLARFREMPRNV